jgi:hypothetical protein
MKGARKWLIGLLIGALCLGAGIGIGTEVFSQTEVQVQHVEVARQFKSLSELQSWLAEDDTDSYAYIPVEFDCEDFAMMLQRNSLNDGYIISVELVDTNWDGYIDHAMNTAIIGNSIYLIEPQTDGVWFYCYCD